MTVNDNGSSNSGIVAIVAILIIVLILGGLIYFFETKKPGETSTPTHVTPVQKVIVPSTSPEHSKPTPETPVTSPSSK